MPSVGCTRLDWHLLLYYITDRHEFSGDEREQRKQLLTCISACAAAGVDWIQLREKDLPPRELELLAQEAKQAITGTATKVLINTRIDIAIACELDGVHLTSSSHEIAPSDARVIFAKAGIVKPLIGISCHTEKEVLLGDSHGADFAVFGPVFGKNSQATGDGVARLSALRGKVAMSILALGGVTLENAHACMEAGAAGVAGISLFQHGNVAETVKELRAR